MVTILSLKEGYVAVEMGHCDTAKISTSEKTVDTNLHTRKVVFDGY